MKILMSSTSGAGHVGPLVPFARAARRAGHEVLMAVPHKSTSIVERAGLDPVSIGYPSDEEMGPVWARVERAAPEDKDAIVVNEVFGRLYTRAALPLMIDLVDSWGPDLIVHESGELSATLAAELRRVPQARVAVTLGLEDEFHSMLHGALDDLRAELGLPEDSGLELVRRSPELSLAPPSFYAASGRVSHRFRTPAEPAPPLPDWWPGDRRPLAYVTLGTAIPQMDFFPELFRATVDSLQHVPARILFTVGVHREPAELGPVPANVHVEQWVDQDAVLPHAAAVAGHGGSGTTLGTLAHGIPTVVLPQFADQPQNADRVQALGAGMALHGGPAAVPQLADALSTLLAEPSYRAAAARVAAEIAALPLVDESVAILEGIAAAGYDRRTRAAA